MSERDYIPVPRWILARSDVSWGAMILFGLLTRYTRQHKEAFPSIDRLSQDLGMTSRRTIQAWLKELQMASLVTVERTGRASTYRVAAGREAKPEESQSDVQNPAHQIRNSLHIRCADLGTSDTQVSAHQVQNAPSSPILVKDLVDDLSSAQARAQQPATYRDLVGASPPRRNEPRREPPAEPTESPAHRALRVGYAQRMGALGITWMSWAAAATHIATCAATIEAQSQRLDAPSEAVAEAWLTAAWADERMRKALDGKPPPWSWLAKEPERWLTAASPVRTRRDELRDAVLEGKILTDEEREEAGLSSTKPKRDALGRALAASGGGRLPT